MRRKTLETSEDSIETRKAQLIVLEKANTHVENIGANLHRMVEQADEGAAKDRREASIFALEKNCC